MTNPALSVALITNPDIRERTNIHLRGAGMRLDVYEAHDGTKSLLVMNTHTESRSGIVLHENPTSNRQGTPPLNRINAWFNTDHFETDQDVDAGKRMLTVIARAEDKAHEERGNTTRPDMDAVLLHNGLNTAMRGRMAQAAWYQEGTRDDGSIPEPRPMKLIEASQKMNIADKDGNFLRINKGDYIGSDLEGTLHTISAYQSMGVLDVERTATAHVVQARSERAVNIMHSLKNTNSQLAVFVEGNEQASIACQTSDGAVRTLKTYGWKQAAEDAMKRDEADLLTQKGKFDRSVSSAQNMKEAFSR